MIHHVLDGVISHAISAQFYHISKPTAVGFAIVFLMVYCKVSNQKPLGHGRSGGVEPARIKGGVIHKSFRESCTARFSFIV